MKTTTKGLLVTLLALFFFIPNAQARRICYYFYMDNTEKHQYEDKNVKVYMTVDRIYVENKTDKIIYVDKERSFSILNGSYTKMFSNEVTTSGASNNTGVGINLGMFNRRLSGITVGGGHGEYSQTATYEQRIVPIPPHAKTVVCTWKHPFQLMAQNGTIKDNGSRIFPLTPRSRYIEQGKKIKLVKGFTRTFNLETSPLRYKTLITYALTEDLKDAKEVSTDENYLKAIVADSYKGWKDYRAEILPYCQPFMADSENYVCWSLYKEGQRLEDWELLLGAPTAFILLLLAILPT